MLIRACSVLFGLVAYSEFSHAQVQKREFENPIQEVSVINQYGKVTVQGVSSSTKTVVYMSKVQGGEACMPTSEATPDGRLNVTNSVSGNSGKMDCQFDIEIQIANTEDVRLTMDVENGATTIRNFAGKLDFDIVKGDLLVTDSQLTSIRGEVTQGTVSISGDISGGYLAVKRGNIFFKFTRVPRGGASTLKAEDGNIEIEVPTSMGINTNYSLKGTGSVESQSGDFKHNLTLTIPRGDLSVRRR